MFVGICEIFADILRKNQIKWTRLPKESDLDGKNDFLQEFLNEVVQNAKKVEDILTASGIWYDTMLIVIFIFFLTTNSKLLKIESICREKVKDN